MAHPFFVRSRPLVFAHRGGGGLAPENTLAAFDEGLEHGADGLELDVRLSRDGVVVVHHDARLDRTTNLTGPVASYTAAELAAADAGWCFEGPDGRPFRGRGCGVPTLEAVLARYPGVPVIIELKVNSPALAHATIEVVRRARAVDRVCVGAFGLRVLQAVRALDPEVATSAAREEVRWALYRSWVRWPRARCGYGGFQVPETSNGTRVVSQRFVETAHRAGLAVDVWTIDRPDDACRLLEWGVDGLITDRPDLIVPFVRPRARSQAGG